MSVLVVVSNSEEAGPLLRWGARFANARQTTLTVLQVARGAKPSEPKAVLLEDTEDTNPVRQAIRAAIGEKVIDEMSNRFKKSRVTRLEELAKEHEAEHAHETESQRRERLKTTDVAMEKLKDEEFLTVRSVTHPSAEKAVLAEVKAAKASLLVVGIAEEGGLAEDLSDSCPCDLVVLRAAADSGESCGKVLVPSAGGPHARVALRLAEGLAKHGSAQVAPLFVCVPAVAEEVDIARSVGLVQLRKAIGQAGISSKTEGVTPRVVLARSPRAGIAKAGKEGYDLVMMGASGHGAMSQLLFGSVPSRLLKENPDVAVAIFRKARPLATRAVEVVDNILARWFPPLERDDRVALFSGLLSGSRFNVDFAMLIALSTGIAAFGLMQNSGAVVIGAMLVAPLMTPMIAAGLGLVQGNTRLVRTSFGTISRGFLLALAIGAASGYLGQQAGMLNPNHLPDQILARGSATALDLIVAFLSGLAAAYALARPNLSGALPGVAIAAALVPPIATVGIALSAQRYEVSSKAALLFGTNLVAIMLGAATVFRIMGVHGSVQSIGKGVMWARRLTVLLALATIALGSWFVTHLPIWVKGHTTAPVLVGRRLRQSIEARVRLDPRRMVLDVSRSSNYQGLVVVVGAQGKPTAELEDDLEKIAEAVLQRDIDLQLVFVDYKHVDRGFPGGG